MPEQDWKSFFNMVCSGLPEGAECFGTGPYYVRWADTAAITEFGQVRIQIDNAHYWVPFERFFNKLSSDTYVLEMSLKSDMLVLGIRFLSTYYQAFDMRRNQLALVPNIYSPEVAAPFVMTRGKLVVLLPGLFSLSVALMFLTL